MKFLHTGDLHIGKRIFEISLIEEQKNMLEQIRKIAGEESVDVVVIAGDVYDRAVPSTEAVSLLDEFLTALIGDGRKVILISGNHDSPERVAFAEDILAGQGLFVAGTLQEPLKSVTLKDEYGEVVFVCMPFVKPARVGAETCAQAVETMLEGLPERKKSSRYVLVSHFFVTGENGETPELSDSETGVSVGGIDNVPASLLKGFSYVALGHIHKPQQIGNGAVYYAGAPLKYSFSETRGNKSVNLVTLNGAGEVKVEKRILKPLHEMRCVKGRLADLMSGEVLEETADIREDYIQATLTDEEELIDPMGALRSVYPNVLQILLEKNQIKENAAYESRLRRERKSTTALFEDFYTMLRGEPMDEKRRQVVAEAVGKAEASGETEAVQN